MMPFASVSMNFSTTLFLLTRAVGSFMKVHFCLQGSAGVFLPGYDMSAVLGASLEGLQNFLR